MKTLKVAVIAMVAAISGMNIYSSQMEGGMSDVLLANVDALAEIEINSDICRYSPGHECVELITTPSGSYHQTWYDQINKTF
ncbi:MAG: hypothetical protein IJZ00_11910 [Lachnospiraceae bacterium]|nr:hypothetical protein [Lachnospiraceae bacterium]